MTIEKKGLRFLRALVVVITAFLLDISPLSAAFCLESTDGPTSSATISRIEVAQNEWAPTGSQRFVETLMLPDAKDNVLTADGHFLKRSSQLVGFKKHQKPHGAAIFFSAVALQPTLFCYWRNPGKLGQSTVLSSHPSMWYRT